MGLQLANIFKSGGAGVDTGETNDNRLIRSDGTTGFEIQGSAITVSDAGEMSGVTRLDVDNVRIDGNTINSTDTNGDVVVNPDGTGGLLVASGKELKFQDGDGTNYTAFKAPTSLTGDVSFTLPDGDGSNGQFLSTNGSGLLEWGTAGGGGFNLDSNPYAQLGVGGWALYNDSSATPGDMTGGTTTGATFTAEPTETQILSGDYAGAFKLVLDAANRQGIGVAQIGRAHV